MDGGPAGGTEARLLLESTLPTARFSTICLILSMLVLTHARGALRWLTLPMKCLPAIPISRPGVRGCHVAALGRSMVAAECRGAGRSESVTSEGSKTPHVETELKVLLADLR